MTAKGLDVKGNFKGELVSWLHHNERSLTNFM